MIDESPNVLIKFKLFFDSKLFKIVFRSISILSNYFISVLEIQVKCLIQLWQKP